MVKAELLSAEIKNVNKEPVCRQADKKVSRDGYREMKEIYFKLHFKFRNSMFIIQFLRVRALVAIISASLVRLVGLNSLCAPIPAHPALTGKFPGMTRNLSVEV